MPFTTENGPRKGDVRVGAAKAETGGSALPMALQFLAA
jgi:hypothetical protein